LSGGDDGGEKEFMVPDGEDCDVSVSFLLPILLKNKIARITTIII
jgi:hypothetical protein